MKKNEIKFLVLYHKNYLFNIKLLMIFTCIFAHQSIISQETRMQGQLWVCRPALPFVKRGRGGASHPPPLSQVFGPFLVSHSEKG